MGIREFIDKKKQMFFVARDSDKMELQKAALQKELERSATERKNVEEVRKLQHQIRENENATHMARTEGSRAIGQKIKGGFGNFSQNVKRLDEGRPRANIWDKNTFGEVKQGPFATGGPMGDHTPKKKGDHPFRR